MTVNVANVLDTIEAKIKGDRNESFERYKLNKRGQKEGESMESYIIALGELAGNCNFYDCFRDSLLRDRIVQGITDKQARQQLLRTKDLTLTQCIDTCRTYEAAKSQIQVISGNSMTSEVNRVSQQYKEANSSTYQGRASQNPNKAEKFITDCRYCG